MILKTKKEFIFQGDCFMKALSSNERLLILINCFYNLANAMSALRVTRKRHFSCTFSFPKMRAA